MKPESSAPPKAPPLLQVENLRTSFFTALGELKAVDGVSFSIDHGEALGIVGESGSGKSITAMSIMGLVGAPGRVVGGTVHLEGQNLLDLDDRAMGRIRGNRMSMVFQEPMTSLNPVHRIGRQVGEILEVHQPGLGAANRRREVIRSLEQVSIPEAAQRAQQFPHQLSGGMRQRVMLAMALAAGSSRLLIADEPTTALDVTIQAQILELIRSLREQRGLAVMLVTHDLGVVAESVDRVVVMYAGQVVETTDVRSLFRTPLHPYTKGLIGSLPQRNSGGGRRKKLYSIPGVVPNLLALPAGCRFAPRCAHFVPGTCAPEVPALKESAVDHWVRCARADEMAPGVAA
jgi:oligopeptide/dipeptide ABC transporter ATP-binding protein